MHSAAACEAAARVKNAAPVKHSSMFGAEKVTSTAKRGPRNQQTTPAHLLYVLYRYAEVFGVCRVRRESNRASAKFMHIGKAVLTLAQYTDI